MPRLTIDIPEELGAKMQSRAAQTGHQSLEEYVEALIRNDAEEGDFGAPDHLRVTSREQLEALLLEGLNSLPREMTAADWEAEKQRLIEKHRQPKPG